MSLGLFVLFTFHPLLFLSQWHFAGWPAHMSAWDGNCKILRICCGSTVDSSLGLLLWGNVPQFIPKFVFVSHRYFFFLIVHCLLQKQRLGSWAEVEMRELILHHFTLNWSCCYFIPGLIYIRVPLLHPLLFCILIFTFMRLTLWYAPNLPLHFSAMAFPI